MPMSFFLDGVARRTELHLEAGGHGNFGPWGLLDLIFGSNIPDGDDDERDRRFQGRVSEAIDRSNRRVREGTLRRNTKKN